MFIESICDQFWWPSHVMSKLICVNLILSIYFLWTSSIVQLFDYLTFDIFWQFYIFWHFDTLLKGPQPVTGLFLVNVQFWCYLHWWKALEIVVSNLYCDNVMVQGHDMYCFPLEFMVPVNFLLMSPLIVVRFWCCLHHWKPLDLLSADSVKSVYHDNIVVCCGSMSWYVVVCCQFWNALDNIHILSKVYQFSHRWTYMFWDF